MSGQIGGQHNLYLGLTVTGIVGSVPTILALPPDRRATATHAMNNSPCDVHSNPSHLISLILMKAQIDVLWFASG